jgi:hypothetical protein
MELFLTQEELRAVRMNGTRSLICEFEYQESTLIDSESSDDKNNDDHDSLHNDIDDDDAQQPTSSTNTPEQPGRVCL